MVHGQQKHFCLANSWINALDEDKWNTLGMTEQIIIIPYHSGFLSVSSFRALPTPFVYMHKHAHECSSTIIQNSFLFSHMQNIIPGFYAAPGCSELISCCVNLLKLKQFDEWVICSEKNSKGTPALQVLHVSHLQNVKTIGGGGGKKLVLKWCRASLVTRKEIILFQTPVTFLNFSGPHTLQPHLVFKTSGISG